MPKGPEKTLNLRGKRSPLAVIMIAKQAKILRNKEVLRVLADDKRTVEEVSEWARRVGNVSVEVERAGDNWSILIRRTRRSRRPDR